MDFKKVKGAALVCIAVLVLVYAGFFVVNRQADDYSSKGITTETAMYGQVSDSLQTQGFAIREESVITQNYSGVLNYRVANGTRVPKGGVIAEVYLSEGDAAAKNKVDRLDREIESLSALAQPIDYYASTPAAIGTQIYQALGGVLINMQKNNFSGVEEIKEDLLISLSRKQVITGEESTADYAQRVAELQAERDQLVSRSGQAVGSLEAPAAGYFIGATDGFESVMDVKEVKDITPAQVEELLAMEQGAGPQSSVGKICLDFKWYLVCNLDDNSMIKFEGVEDVSLDVPFASAETIPAHVVEKSNRDPATGKTAVVLECTYMDADIATVRNEAVQINVKQYEGVLVNEKALRFVDFPVTQTDGEGNETTRVYENVKGVYVLYGERIQFVQVFTEKNVNGYAVCKTQLSEEEEAMLVTDRTVQLYDEVVVGGTNLYDGKIVS